MMYLPLCDLHASYKEGLTIQFSLSNLPNAHKNPNPNVLIIFKILFSIIMSTANTIIDHFNMTDDEVFVPHKKIQSNNIWFNPTLSVYPEELKMLVQCLNNSILAHALTSSFAIPMNWLSLSCFTTVYNNMNEFVTF